MTDESQGPEDPAADPANAEEAAGSDVNAATQPPSPPPAAADAPAADEPAAPTRQKADVGKRIVAAIIDSVISGIVSIAIPAIGGIIGAIYMVLRDGMDFDFMNHRSIGKNVMKLHIESVDGSALDISTSIKRNWMFALGVLIPVLLFIPILGWIAIPFVALGAVVLGVIELVLVLTDGQGRRLGDKMAGTMVVED